MASLSPKYIAAYYTLAEIDAKIERYQTALDSAAEGSYRLEESGMGGNQWVTPPNPDKVEALLAVYLKARMIKSGQNVGPVFTNINYTP